jgi:hypothetical protein
VYFVASKLAAFHGRGAEDVTLSHDLEDIIAVIDGRAEIVGEIAEAESQVRKYINSEIGALLKNEDFVEALSGYLLRSAGFPEGPNIINTARLESNVIAFPARLEPLLIASPDLMSFLRCEMSLPDPGLDKTVRAIVCQSAR